jgi:alkylated DNA repair dioxygenase AlkB
MDTALNQMRFLPSGASYAPDFISLTEEGDFEKRLDAGVWSNELRRRVQHFGYRYDYKARAVTPDAYLGKLPEWLQHLGDRLVAAGYFDEVPDQIIANEYLPRQGISAHVDCEPCFGDTIVSLSLLSHCEMVFREKRTGTKLATLLEPRSVIIMKNAARFVWTHEIPARISDIIGGIRVERSRRISLTFRKVIRTK